MSRAERGLFWDMAAFAWDSEEPGTITLPIQDFAKLLGVSPKVLTNFLVKFPKTFVKLSESFEETFGKLDSSLNKLVQPKLAKQWTNYKEISEKRRKAAETRYANAEHKDHSAFASASASAFAVASKPNTRPPLPPASGGNGNGFHSHDELLKDETNYSYMPWKRGHIVIRTGRHKRVLSKGEVESMAGCSIEAAVEKIRAKGFWAEIYKPSEPGA
jgi:hypothetical protein